MKHYPYNNLYSPRLGLKFTKRGGIEHSPQYSKQQSSVSLSHSLGTMTSKSRVDICFWGASTPLDCGKDYCGTGERLRRRVRVQEPSRAFCVFQRHPEWLVGFGCTDRFEMPDCGRFVIKALARETDTQGAGAN